MSPTLLLVGGVVLTVVLLLMGAASLRSRRVGGSVTIIDESPAVPKEHWTMPPLTLLSRARWSSGRRAAMAVVGQLHDRRPGAADRQIGPAGQRVITGAGTYSKIRPLIIE